MDNNNIIELKNINKSYGVQNKTQVLFDLSISFKKGTLNSIIGQSGSGKSTLLNIMGTLDKPDSGTVYLDNIDVTKINKNDLSKLRNLKIGFIFQFHYLLPEFTAYENILMPYKISGRKIDNKVEKEVEEIIKVVGLEKVKNNKASDMSGGQQQRVAIARSLTNKPDIIFADEPTGNLDSKTSDEVYNLLRKINDTYKTTFVVITHDKKIAEKTDRIVEIVDGKVKIDITKGD